VLIVDDEQYVRDSLALILTRKSYTVRTAASCEEALSPSALDGLDAVITDLKMNGDDGLKLLRHLKKESPDLPVIMLTAYGTVNSAVEAMKSGAYDFLQKPVDPEEVTCVLARALERSTMKRELKYLRSGVGATPVRNEPIGRSEGWKKVVELVEAAAPTDTTVLLLGESGTGKDEVARLIHRKSLRVDRPFVRVNCAAVPVELFESEFFGHRKGSFTGAHADQDGRFRVAHEGTLFMDEVGCLPLGAQAKVLRVLQDGEFERVGETQPTTVDVRVVAATNSDLEAEVAAGRFRKDLFYRINVFTIHIPPLRERLEDVDLLASAFLEEFSLRIGKQLKGIEPDALKALQRYSWPGNIRELRNVIERAVILEKSSSLSLDSLPANVGGEVDPEEIQSSNLRDKLLAEEKRILLEALRQAAGVRREVARQLGIDERNLSYYLRKHGLERWQV